MSDVKRYRFSRCKLHFDPHVCLCGKVEHPDGDYVLYAEHACIVAEKDAEIQRLREALETLAAPLDDKKRPYEGWFPVRALARKWGIYEEDVQDAIDLIPLIARAALNPPQQKGTSNEE